MLKFDKLILKKKERKTKSLNVRIKESDKKILKESPWTATQIVEAGIRQIKEGIRKRSKK